MKTNISLYLDLDFIAGSAKYGLLSKDVVAKAFVKTLVKYKNVYHFDEDAHDIMEAHTGATLFSHEEAELCNYIRDYCYSNYLFELAVKASNGEVRHEEK